MSASRGRSPARRLVARARSEGGSRFDATMTTVGSDALAAQMKARTDAELVRICTLEAGDYTQDAVAVAREELASRGQDVTTLVASAPAERPADPRKGGGTLMVLGLALAAFSAPWSDELPRALLIALEAAAASLVMVGAFRAFASSGSS